MTAKEYYNNQDRFEYFTKLTNTGIDDDFDEIMAFAEAYHEHKLKLLGIADAQRICKFYINWMDNREKNGEEMFGIDYELRYAAERFLNESNGN